MWSTNRGPMTSSAFRYETMALTRASSWSRRVWLRLTVSSRRLRSRREASSDVQGRLVPHLGPVVHPKNRMDLRVPHAAQHDGRGHGQGGEHMQQADGLPPFFERGEERADGSLEGGQGGLALEDVGLCRDLPRSYVKGRDIREL